MPLDFQDFKASRREAARRHVLSAEAVDLIQRYEGFRQSVYDDLRPNVPLVPESTVAGTLTIGYGHTGEFARFGVVLSRGDAEELLIGDLELYEEHVRRLVTVPLTSGEYGALVAFAYNVGAESFARSTLLRLLNAEDYEGAAGQFPRWVYSKGQRLEGLLKRRMAEQAMFIGASGWLRLLTQDAEDLLDAGSRATPDAADGRELMKPLRQSKTIWAAGLGGLTGVIASVAELAQLQLPYWLLALMIVCLFAYLIVNRVLEHRAGEH